MLLTVITTGLLYFMLLLNKIPVISLLVSARADVNALTKTYKQTPLMLASNNGKDEIVRLLIESQADVNSKDICGEQALHHAAKEGSSKVIELLCKCTKDTVQESGLGLNPLDCTIHKILAPLAGHRTDESAQTANISVEHVKSYQIISSHHPASFREVAKTDEVVRLAEVLTDLAVRAVKKKKVNRHVKHIRYSESESESESSSEDVGSDTDEFSTNTQPISIPFSTDKFRLPVWGKLDIDMTDIPDSIGDDKEEKEKEKQKGKKKRSSSSSEKEKGKDKKKKKKKGSSSSEEEKKKKKKKKKSSESSSPSSSDEKPKMKTTTKKKK